MAWFAHSGMKLKEAISMRPPLKTPTAPTRFMHMESKAESSACTTKSTGATKRNVNSMGSVTPQSTAVSVTGMRSARSC